MGKLSCLTSVAAITLFASGTSSIAQQPTATWSSVAKIANGNCGDGAVAQVTERAGTMNVKLTYPNGSQYADISVTLAADGSGRAEFQGYQGLTLLEISAGSGKRTMTSKSTVGICQWTWAPR